MSTKGPSQSKKVEGESMDQDRDSLRRRRFPPKEQPMSQETFDEFAALMKKAVGEEPSENVKKRLTQQRVEDIE